MKLLPNNLNISFMKARAVFVGVSLAFMLASLVIWLKAGDEKYGVDFLGGSEVVVKFEPAVSIESVRNAVKSAGITGAVVQSFEQGTSEFAVRMKAEPGVDTPKKIRSALETIEETKLTLLKEDFIGPLVGSEIRKAGLTALVVALAGMLLYISIRFEFRFACGALGALVHDIVITSGVFVFAGYEFSTAVIAGLLTIVGYSLNDTIVVFDRIRENLAKALKTGSAAKKQHLPTEFTELVNLSINQTLSRTLLTSVTTLFVVTTLWVLGGGAIVELAFTLVVGVVVGTYSSIFIASPIVVALENRAIRNTKDRS